MRAFPHKGGSVCDKPNRVFRASPPWLCTSARMASTRSWRMRSEWPVQRARKTGCAGQALPLDPGTRPSRSGGGLTVSENAGNSSFSSSYDCFPLILIRLPGIAWQFCTTHSSNSALFQVSKRNFRLINRRLSWKSATPRANIWGLLRTLQANIRALAATAKANISGAFCRGGLLGGLGRGGGPSSVSAFDQGGGG